MAESPYVNVRESRIAKESEPQYYTNVEVQNNDGKCEEYQIVQERGRDPNGEYTVTANSSADKVSDATLRRQRMIHSLLFPSQTQTRRFNYTDIQLTPNTPSEEQPTTGESDVVIMPSRSKPRVKPKPKLVVTGRELDELSIQAEELACDMDEQVPKKSDINSSCRVCTWKCTTALFLTLFVVSMCISLVAIGIAATAFSNLPQACDQDLIYSSCMIRPSVPRDNQAILANNSCDTSTETVSEDLKLSLGFIHCAYSSTIPSYPVSSQLQQQGEQYNCHCWVHQSEVSLEDLQDLQVNCTMILCS